MKERRETKDEPVADLRAAAEMTLALVPTPESPAADAILHELQVHQIELEMQNEELRKTQLALEDARDRYINLFEFAPVGYLTLSRNGIIDQINLTATRMLGIERACALGHRLVEFVVDDDRDRCHVHLRKLCKAPAGRACELRLQRPDGEQFPVRLDGVAVPLEYGVIALRITLTDISEAQELAALNASETRLRLAIEAIPGGLYDWDRPVAVLHWRSSFAGNCKFTDSGFPLDRKWWRERVHADDLRRIRPVLVEVIKQGRQHFSVEYRMRCKDGGWCHVLDRGQILRDAQGRVARLVGTMTDISAYKETALRQSQINEILEEQVVRRTAEAETRAVQLVGAERFARETLDSIDMRLCVLDEYGGILATNKAWREFEVTEEIACTHSHRTVLERPWPYGMACWTPAANDKVEQAVSDLLAQRRDVFVLEYECASPKLPRWFEMNITRFAGAGPVRLVIRHKEITARKQAELEQRRSTERIKRLGRHVDAASEARNAEVARELHDELGASLTMLKLGLATLAEQPRKADASNTFAALLDQVDNALKVTRRISGSLRPATLDTLGLVTTVKSHVRQFSLTTGIDAKLLPARAHFKLPDATNIAVFRIIQEALTNVAKHSGASHVIINARKYRGVMFVRVVDDGTGIRDSALQRPEAFGIVGMRERAQHLGGTLSIGSRLYGRGTRLTLRVPIEAPRKISEKRKKSA